MQIKSLKIFCDVVDRRSFSLAAADNRISQSSASQVVHQLEQRLGVQLLDRSKRPFVLTAEGERFYDGSRQLVKHYSELEEEVRTLHDESSRRLLVASIYSVGLAHMSEFMQRFSAKYPLAQVRLDYLHPERVLQIVDAGEVDLGLVSYPEETRTRAVLAWRSEPMVLVCHPQHPLAKGRTVLLKELAGESLVAFELGLRIRSEIDRALSKARVKVDVALEFDNIETMKRAIEIGQGVSILPEPTVAREIALGTLAKVALPDSTLCRPLGIVYRRDRNLGIIGEQFIRLLRASSESPLPALPATHYTNESTTARVG